jgi:DnaJ family protein A protein 2
MFESLFSNRSPQFHTTGTNVGLYNDLELPPEATVPQIKKAYHRLARTHHPDKGGDPDRFKEIYHAYEVLSDVQKRAAYDRFGDQGLGANSNFPRPPPPPPSRRFQLKVRLEDIYTSTTKIIKLTRSISCPPCDGLGGVGNSTPCSGCSGRGVTKAARPIGPGMMQQVFVKCDDCRGQGVVFLPPAQICANCHGEKIVDVCSPLHVSLRPDMETGTTLRFPLGDTEDTSILVVLEVEPHTVFTRHGLNLFMKMTINLRESLTGFMTKKMSHLGNRSLWIQSPGTTVLTPGSYLRVPGEGMMPSGDLYIEFRVVFPTTVVPPNLLLDHCFAAPEVVVKEDDDDVVFVVVAEHVSEEKVHQASSDPDHLNQNRSGCQTQ